MLAHPELTKGANSIVTHVCILIDSITMAIFCLTHFDGTHVGFEALNRGGKWSKEEVSKNRKPLGPLF